MTDVFDGLLNSTCTVYERESTTGDAYGQPDPALVPVVTNVACRASVLKSGREWEAGRRYAENDWMIYCRPIARNDVNQPFELSARHWLRVTLQDGKVLLLNLKAVNDPSGVGHHLEARGTEIVA